MRIVAKAAPDSCNGEHRARTMANQACPRTGLGQRHAGAASGHAAGEYDSRAAPRVRRFEAAMVGVEVNRASDASASSTSCNGMHVIRH
jgi:hypothetical protein